MTALLELAPLAEAEAFDDLDELLFGDDTDDLHISQNCFSSAVCGNHTHYCFITA